MSDTTFAADKANPRPSVSSIRDDSPVESEILHNLCKKTLVEVDSVVLAMRSMIFEIYAVLDAPLYGSVVCESESYLSHLPDSSCDVSMVPETEQEGQNCACGGDFESPEAEPAVVKAEETEPFIPLTDSMWVGSVVPETEQEGPNCACGGNFLSPEAEAEAEPVVVKVEEMEPFIEEMFQILLPRYFKRVRSFPLVAM